jgi:hypothetical protein
VDDLKFGKAGAGGIGFFIYQRKEPVHPRNVFLHRGGFTLKGYCHAHSFKDSWWCCRRHPSGRRTGAGADRKYGDFDGARRDCNTGADRQHRRHDHRKKADAP